MAKRLLIAIAGLISIIFIPFFVGTLCRNFEKVETDFVQNVDGPNSYIIVIWCIGFLASLIIAGLVGAVIGVIGMSKEVIQWVKEG